MSTSLYWRPVPGNKMLGYSLKFAIAPKLNWGDGSLSSNWTDVDESLIPFLEGVISSGNKDVVKEAKKLTQLIKTYGTIQIALIT